MDVTLGNKAHLLCLHNSSHLEKPTNITWWRILQVNYTLVWPPQYLKMDQGSKNEMTISSVNKSHGGLYRCTVQYGNKTFHSCGTYLRVRGECLSWLQGPTTLHLGPLDFLSRKWGWSQCLWSEGASAGPCWGQGGEPGL